MDSESAGIESLAAKFATWISARGGKGTVGEVVALTGGLSTQMNSVTWITSDGAQSRYVLRQPSDWTLSHKPGAVLREYRILQQLQALGIAAPIPFGMDEQGSHLGRPTLVLEYLAGAPALRPRNLSHFLAGFAEHLAQIHQLSVEGEGWSFLMPAEGMTWNPSEDSAPAGEPPFLSEAREALRNCEVTPSLPGSRLVHGDFWPANALWRDNQWVATIDWEECGLGDPLLDLSISRLDLAWAFGWDAMTEFTESYLSHNPLDVSTLPFWDLRTALRPGAKLGEWAAGYLDLGREDVTFETMSSTLQQFVDQALSRLR